MSQGTLIDAASSPPSLLARVGSAFLALAAAHFVIDFLATLLPSSLGLLEVRSGMTHEQAAWVFGLGSFTSGLAQPLCAIVSDRLGTRLPIVMGLAVATIGFGFIGMSTKTAYLSTLYIVGMVGAGMFHPIAATTVAKLHYHRRNTATGVFFVAGMLGGIVGAVIWPRWLATSGGFDRLPLIVVPFLLFTYFIHRHVSQLPPVQQLHMNLPDLSVLRGNWTNVALLYLASAMRYTINTALVYLFVRWRRIGSPWSTPSSQSRKSPKNQHRLLAISMPL